MLTLSECVGLSDLAQEEVQVIAEHEHVPDIVAAEIGHGLLRTPRGLYRLHCIFLDEIERASASGHREKARHIDRIYTRFRASYPMPRVL